MSDQQDVCLDLNNREFQEQLFNLDKNDQRRSMVTLRKLSKMTWEQVYRDPGLHWETIHSRSGPGGERLYSFRVSKKFRAVAFREGDFMKLLSLHPDHDSAY